MTALTLTILCALAGIGINKATEPGEILSKYGDWLEKQPDYIRKPLGLCAACTAGQLGLWFGLIAAIGFVKIELVILVLVPAAAIGAAVVLLKN